MGSPLRPSISEFYISHIENKIFNTIKKPKIYVRYVDDISIATESNDEINKLKQSLEKNSVLKFITGLIINKKNPIQDVLTDSSNNDKFLTSLFKKSTSHQSA